MCHCVTTCKCITLLSVHTFYIHHYVQALHRLIPLDIRTQVQRCLHLLSNKLFRLSVEKKVSTQAFKTKPLNGMDGEKREFKLFVTRVEMPL